MFFRASETGWAFCRDLIHFHLKYLLTPPSSNGPLRVHSLFARFLVILFPAYLCVCLNKNRTVSGKSRQFGVSLLITTDFSPHRFIALHQRAECVHSATGQFTDWTLAKFQLGRRLQIFGHHPPSHVLWKWGGSYSFKRIIYWIIKLKSLSGNVRMILLSESQTNNRMLTPNWIMIQKERFIYILFFLLIIIFARKIISI